MEAIHPIGAVERRTGLSSHVIRVWERRYGAVAPRRSAGNQRLYTDADIERLVLLAQAVENGESIGRIAGLPSEDLRQLAKPEQQIGSAVSRTPDNDISGEGETDTEIIRAIKTIESPDNMALRAVISDWLYTYGIADLIEKLVPELLVHVGEKWRAGEFDIYQEHMASETIRSFLGTVLDDVNNGNRSSLIITATPPGELHDIGALLSAIAAATAGFNVIHLGADVPFPELIRLALVRRPAAILLSFIFHSTDRRLIQGLQSLREMIDPETLVFIGGRSAGWFHSQLDGEGILHVATLSDLKAALARLPNPDSL